MNFDKIKILFDSYIENVYFKIKEQFMNVGDIERYKRRIFMIKQKYTHTMRVVENIEKLANKMGQSINFLELTKTVGLFHDIGRFEQVKYSDIFVDSEVYKNHKMFSNHGEEGAYYLSDKGFDEFLISKEYRPSIEKVVMLHQSNLIPEEFDLKVSKELNRINPDTILTGNVKFNEYEQKIISLLLQMVRDIDKIDILYQRACGEIKAMPDIITVSNIGINKIIDIWGLDIIKLKKLNSENDLINSSKIRFFRKDVPIEKLFVKDEIKAMIYKGENISLRDLQLRDDYSFVTALWWSIYTFLNDINFVSNLEVIDEDDLLNKIYDRYEDEYKVLIDEIFKYAKYFLIKERIEKNKNDLYVLRRNKTI